MTIYTVTFDPMHAPHANHELTSDYFQTYYLPLLGPTTTAIMQAFGRIYDRISYSSTTPTTYVPIEAFGQSLGLASRKTGYPTRGFFEALKRLERPYDLITRTGPDSLTVAAYAPTLHDGRISRLPDHLKTLHAESINA